MPVPSRPFCLLDITKFYGETTGGIRTYLRAKARYVQDHPGLRQVIVVPGVRSEVEDDGNVRWYHVRGPRIPTQHPYRFLLDRRALAGIIARERPDIIEVGSPYLVPWMVRGPARRIGIPLAWFFHTNFPRIIAPRPDTMHGARPLLARAAWRYVAALGRRVDAVLAASDATARDLEAAGVPRVHRVSLGVDLDHFHPRRRGSRDATRREAGLPEGPVVMFAGRLAREKDLDLVLAGWPRVHSATGATLALVGDGPSRRRMLRDAGPGVAWIPYQRDRERLANLIASADCCLAPGPAETFGLAALEALASGVPVISANLGGVPDLVRASGAGKVVPMEDAEALARAINEVLAAPAGSLAARARQWAELHHGWDTVMDGIFETYRTLAATPP